MIRFIHAADIHLDSPLRGLSRYEGAPEEEIRGATRRALENLVSFAMESDVHFVLVSGDLYDGNWKDHNTGLFFSNQMSELRRAEIKVFIVSGNHDAQSVITKRLKLPENVYQFSTRHPETLYLDDIGAAIHGQGFPKKAVTDNISANYPAKIPDAFNIGMLHTSLTGRDGHDNYAPCTVDDLIRRGYDYWALGHVHARERIQSDIPICFPGNIQGRHIRETGAKGCLLVTVDDAGDVDVAFQELDVLRWSEASVDITNARNRDDCLELFHQRLTTVLDDGSGRFIAMRARFTGESAAYETIASRPDSFINSVRSVANDYGHDRVWVEKVELAGNPPSSRFKDDFPEGPLGELVHVIDSYETDDSALAELGSELFPLIGKLPVELREGADSLHLDEPGKLRAILKQVHPLLMARLRGVEGNS